MRKSSGPINSPRSRGKCAGIVPARPSGYFLRRAGDWHRGQLGSVSNYPSLLSRTRPGRASPNSDLAAFAVLTAIVIGKLFSDGSRSTSAISPDISLTGGVSRTLVNELNYDGAVPTIFCTFGQRAAIRGQLRRHVPRDPVSIALPVIGEGAKVICRNRGGKQIKKSRNKKQIANFIASAPPSEGQFRKVPRFEHGECLPSSH
ncbi:MAG: hypothetical protein QOF64_2005 [Candidatus Binatota bacterium]|nr:hypothetical protein [Candidatus Binatota bacterium]